MADDLNSEMIEFVSSITTAMGLDADVSVESIEDGTRIVITGEGSDVFLQRKAAGLDPLEIVLEAKSDETVTPQPTPLREAKSRKRAI